MPRFAKNEIVMLAPKLSDSGRYGPYKSNPARISAVKNNYNVSYNIVVLDINDYSKPVITLTDVSENSLIKAEHLNKNNSDTHFTVEGTLSLIEDLSAKRDKLSERINAEEAKLSFLKENAITVATYNEYKAFKILRIANNNELSELERARAIAVLISNK